MDPCESATLQSTDWNLEWGRIHESRSKPGDAAYWDSRAASFDSETAPNDYLRSFITCADVRPGESVFDMGCGTGSLCMEYAQAGHEVLGADFSAGMLAQARSRAAKRNRTSTRFLQMSWEDDWKAHGVLPGSFDVSISSRSIATADMAGALFKLSAVARRRCIITLSVGGSPRVDTRALDACGIERLTVRDFQYALNILANAGYLPEVSYITSERVDSFASLDDAMGAYRASLGELSENQVGRLRQWLQSELIVNERAGEPNGHGGKHKHLRLAHPRQFRWAMITWSV